MAAGVRQPLIAVALQNDSFQVMKGRFLTIQQAMALPKARAAGHAFAKAFVEEMKAAGFVAAALARSGQSDATVAGPAEASG